MKRAIRVILLAALCLVLCLGANAEETERQYVTLGQTDLTVNAEGTASVYFTAPEAGTYAFYSTSTKDAGGFLYTEDETGTLTLIAQNYYSGPGNNFLVEYDLEANQVVRLDASYFNEIEETLPLTIVQRKTVTSDAALTLGETEFDLAERTYVNYTFEPGEQSGYYSFKMSIDDANVAVYDQNGVCIHTATSNIYSCPLNGGERYTVRVGLSAYMEAQKASLTIFRYDGALEPIANVYIDGVRVEEGMVVPAYRALTVTFDAVDNAQYYEINTSNTTFRVEPGQSAIVSYAPGAFGFSIDAKADNWVTSSFYHNVKAEETEVQPELTLSVNSAVNSENDLVTFTVAQTDAPVTLWGASGSWSGELQKMLLMDGAYVAKCRIYSGTYQVWATDTLGRVSNRVEVTWNPPEQNEYPVYDSLTQITLDGEPLVSGASVTAGVPIEIGFNLVPNTRLYELDIEQNGQSAGGYSAELNGGKPCFRNVVLPEGIWQLRISAYDMNNYELCSSETYEINAVAPTPSLQLSVDRTQAYVDEQVTLTNPNDTDVYCWAINKAQSLLPNYVGMIGREGNTLSVGPYWGGNACQVEYYISDDYGRVSAPVTVDFLYRGELETPTVSIGDTVLTQEMLMELTAGQEYTLNVSEQANATNYQVHVVYGFQSGNETVVTYEGASNTFTMPDGVRYMRVSAQVLTPGWKTEDTGSILVRVGKVVDSLDSVLVNGVEWHENMTVRALEETVFSWNYITNATHYWVDFALSETQQADSSFGLGDASYSTRFSLNADYVYFRVRAYDTDGGTLLSSTPYMRLSIDHTLPEASFTLTADRDSAYISEPIQFTMERPAMLFRSAANDMYVSQICGNMTAVTDNCSTPGDTTYFAIDEAGNYSNFVTVHYGTKGKLPEPQLYVNDQLCDQHTIFKPGETYTLRAVCQADGLTDPVSYRVYISYYDENDKFISNDEIYEAELTTSVPSEAERCYVDINCTAPCWEEDYRGYNLLCGAASSNFDSVLVNGEPYVQGMTVAPFDQVRISWNYITGASNFSIRVSDPQGHSAGYWHDFSYPEIDIMIDDQREWIDVAIEALSENGSTLCNTTLRLQVSGAAPEPAFTLTPNAQEIYINERVNFSADRMIALYQAEPSRPVMREVSRNSTEAFCTIGQVGTYTFIAVDSEGNRSNSVTVTAKTKGRLPSPSIRLNDELFDSNTPIFLTPGETYTLRIECNANGVTDLINCYGSLYFYDAENANIGSLNIQSEITFTVPEDAVRCSGNFYARAAGWQESFRYWPFVCDVTSGQFDSVTINGKPYVEGMTVAPYEEIQVSWNYITGAQRYSVTWTNENSGFSTSGCDYSRNNLTPVFNAGSSQITGMIKAIGKGDAVLCTKTLQFNLSDVQAPSFTLSADAAEIDFDSSASFTWDREAILYVTMPDQVYAQRINSAYATSAQFSPYDLGTYSFIARDKDGNLSNAVTVACKSRGTLRLPALFFNGTKLTYDWKKVNPVLTPGKTYEITYDFTEAQPEGTCIDLELYYYDDADEYISDDYFTLDAQPASITVPENAASMGIIINVSAPGWENAYTEIELACGQVGSQLTNLRINGETLSGGATVPNYQPVRISYDYVTGAKEYVLYSPENNSLSFNSQNDRLSFIPFVNGTYTFCLDAMDENNEMISEETFTLTFNQSAPEFTITADRDNMMIDEQIKFTSPVAGSWYFAEAGLDAADQYQYEQRENGETVEFGYGSAGLWNAWCVTDDGRRSEAFTFEIRSNGALADPQLLINGAKPEEACILPGDKVQFTLPAIEHADSYFIHISAPHFERSCDGLEEINAMTFTAPDVNSLSVSLELLGDGYESVYTSWEIPLVQPGVSGLKINGVAPEQEVITPYVRTQVSMDAIPGATEYWFQTACTFASDALPAGEVIMVPGEQRLRVQVSGGDEYDTSRKVLAWDSVPVKVSDTIPAPAFQLNITDTAVDGKGTKTLNFGVSGNANTVKKLYVLSPGGWIGQFYSGNSVWNYVMSWIGEYQFWAVDEANQISNIITMSNERQEALKPVSDLRIDGSTPLSAGSTASVTFSAAENAVSYRLQVIGVTADNQRCLLLSTNGDYETINGASFYVPFSAASVTCQVEAFADGYTSSKANTSGDVAGTTSGYRLPASLQTIETEAFSGVGAKVIVVPEGCKTIGANAFAGSTVSEVFLPGSVSSVASNAFPEATHIFRAYEGTDAAIDWTLE